MPESVWDTCLARLEQEESAEQFNMWLKPLQGAVNDEVFSLFAPNRFVLDFVKDKYLSRISVLVGEVSGSALRIRLSIGEAPKASTAALSSITSKNPTSVVNANASPQVASTNSDQTKEREVISRHKSDRRLKDSSSVIEHKSSLNSNFTFE